MRGKLAKKIRKDIYSEFDYIKENTNYTYLGTGQIISDSLRRYYQIAKKLYK